MSYNGFHSPEAYQRGIDRRIAANRAKGNADRANAKRADWFSADPTRVALIEALRVKCLNDRFIGDSFAGKMIEAFDKWGSLTEGQERASRDMVDPAKIAAKQAAKVANAPKVDMSRIHAMFDHAREAGLTKLVYRAHGLVISPAKANSVNAGSLYVKTRDGDYLGKVTGTAFLCSRDATEDHKATLAAVALDPSKASREYGLKTGECCICGRELTKAESVTLGIGPVCKAKWGL